MKIAILTFSEVKIGGIGTQARDFANLAVDCGHEAALINIEHRQTNKFLYGTEASRFEYGPISSGKGMRLHSHRLGSGSRIASQSLDYLSKFDAFIWVGVAPHFNTEDPEPEKREAALAQREFYLKLLRNGKRHIGFCTDRFIDDYYPWVRPHLNLYSGMFAFAGTYAKALGVPCEVVPLAPLDSWRRKKFIRPSTKPRKIFWPHQWRGWKNIMMFLELAERIEVDRIRMFANGGGSIEYSRFANCKDSDLYKRIVVSDVHFPNQRNPKGKLELMGYVPISRILDEYEQTATTPDLTGISKTLKKPNSYVGNYQCATIEAMLFGCALMKFSTTVFPESVIPREAVMLLEPEQPDYARCINDHLKNSKLMDKAAKTAWDWIHEVGNPHDCFRRIIGEKGKK